MDFQLPRLIASLFTVLLRLVLPKKDLLELRSDSIERRRRHNGTGPAAGVPVTLLTCGLGIWKRKGVTTYLFQVLETTKLSVFKLTSHTQNQMNKQAGLH